MTSIIIIVCVFVCVVALVGGVALIFGSTPNSEVEDRLDQLTLGNSANPERDKSERMNLLSNDLSEAKGLADDIFGHFFDLRRFLSQADLNMTSGQFLLLSLGLGAAGVIVVLLTSIPYFFAPILGVLLASANFVFVYITRKRRVTKFAAQLPDALGLVSRALRAGHSLASGFSLVADEMAEPIRSEFNRCYEEQNLGVPLEEALEGMTRRVPNLDLRFFATAVVLQRTTGGDLAEILDKIGHLIRERFKIYGQIQALTGEGRLSGIVLLGLPPVLFIVMFKLNPDYVMVLFSDPIGQWLLAGAVVLQLMGAVVIKKIISIKV